MLYINSVRLKNVRCFEELSLVIGTDSPSCTWAMFVGDNATGKTTLLKSIAMGLCDESSAAGLLKELEEGYIRRGVDGNGEIAIELIDPSIPNQKYLIKTTIEKVYFRDAKGDKDYQERLRQTTVPESNFPWGKIFVSGYGAGRGTAGTGDIAGYAVMNAVYNMFNYSEGLQNPELTIRRIQSNSTQIAILDVLVKILMRDDAQLNDSIGLPPSGIGVDGPWGKGMPLRDLADGYKSTLLWVTDFVGWALSHNPDIKDPCDIQGIVIIDELEQHLHPKWQRTIVHTLRKYFPRVQFISSTHSPIVASSIGKIIERDCSDKLIHLTLKENNRVEAEELMELKGLTADQALASKAFDYLIDADPDVEVKLRIASELVAKGDGRSPEEELEYRELKAQLSKLLPSPGQTLIERELDKERFQGLQTEVHLLEKKLFGAENDTD